MATWAVAQLQAPVNTKHLISVVKDTLGKGCTQVILCGGRDGEADHQNKDHILMAIETSPPLPTSHICDH